MLINMLMTKELTAARFVWIMREDERGKTGNHEDLAVEKERRGLRNKMKRDLKNYGEK